MPDVSAPEFAPQVGWADQLQLARFREVPDVAVDAEDRVYVLTRSPGAILVCHRSGGVIDEWGREVLSDSPHGITVGSDGFLYCVDEMDHAVRKFDLAGKLVATIGRSGMPSDTGADHSITDIHVRIGTVLRGAGPFNRPTALAVAPTGDTYVSDGYGNACVHRFDAAGTHVQSWGRPGTGPGEFHLPHGIGIDALGHVLVADRENERIQRFTLDGEYVDEWTDVQRPAGVALGPDGLIFVAELSRAVGYRSWRAGTTTVRVPSRVSVLDTAGRVVARIGAGTNPCVAGTMAAAHGVAVDSYGDLYVAEVTHTSLRSGGFRFDGRLLPADCHVLQKLGRVG